MINKDITLHKALGASLIELVMIILIVGALAVMPLINWPGTGLNIDAQAKQFADDIRYTQSLSQSKAERYRIVEASATSYQILNSSGTPITFATGSTAITLNSGLSFGTWTNLSSNLIAFDGRGTPYLSTGTPGTALSAATSYTVTITGGGNTKTITITPITGMVLVQ